MTARGPATPLEELAYRQWLASGLERARRTQGLPEFISKERNLFGLLAVAGGLATATGILLVATGRQKEAYALATTGAIVGGTVGAVRLLGRREG